MIEVEEKYMSRCFELARKAKGNTWPNPMVGAVVVHAGKIIGEGYHRQCGEAHAEVNAIASVKDESLLMSSTLYVSLEPCSHYGKTPPCAELIIRKGIPRVVIGCKDPFVAVAGQGIRMLRDAGVEVVCGVLEQEAQALNAPFMTMQQKHRPYILLKWAQSADGFMDKQRESSLEPPVVLSSSETRRRVHKLRAESAAILVGTRTALLDNPSLTVRDWAGRSPIRVVLDQFHSLPETSHLLDGSVPTLIYTEKEVAPRQGVEFVKIDFKLPIWEQLLQDLARRKIDSLMVEGGACVLSQLLEEHLWDEAHVETAPCCLGNGVKAPVITQGRIVSVERCVEAGRFVTIYRY